MAEGLLRAALDADSNIKVSSAGVAAMPGQSMSRETQSILKKHNASLKGFVSRQVDEALLGQASLVIAMTASHAELIKRFFPDSCGEVKLLGDYIKDDDHWAGADVPDPIGMGESAYEEVAEVIEMALPSIIAEIKKTNNN